CARPAHTAAPRPVDQQAGVLHRKIPVVGVDRLRGLVDPSTYLGCGVSACKLPMVQAQLETMLRGWGESKAGRRPGGMENGPAAYRQGYGQAEGREQPDVMPAQHSVLLW